MKKLTDYFYIFSKLTTSLVLVIIIFIMGAVLFNSYKDRDKTSNIVDTKFDSLTNIVNLNKLEINQVNKKFIEINNNINKMILAIKSNDKSNNQNIYDKDIKNLEVVTGQLKNQMNKILLKENLDNEINSSKLESKYFKRNSLIEFILIKYQNRESIIRELALLEKISPNNNQVFEKLNVVILKNYLGKKNLENLFKISTNNFLNTKIKDKNKNVLIDFLMKFISIKINDSDFYDNGELDNIQQAQKLFLNENYQDALKLILSIDKKQVYYDSWIKQLNIYIVFEKTLRRII